MKYDIFINYSQINNVYFMYYLKYKNKAKIVQKEREKEQILKYTAMMQLSRCVCR